MQQKPLVSVLVNTRNSARTIKKLFESIKNQSYKEIEIIVVDNNSSDNTVLIAKKFTKNMYSFGPERSAQRNYAAKKATGKYLLFLDSDMILGRTVVEQCVDRVGRKAHIKAVVIPEESIGKGFWAKCKRLERSFYVGIDWIEAARFFEKQAFENLGGYDEQNTGTEDYDLPQRFKRMYGEKATGRINAYILHDEGELSLFKLMKKKFYYAQKLPQYKKNNLKEFSVQSNLLKRYMLFLSHPQKLFAHPILGLGVFFMKACEFGAGGLGFIFKKEVSVYDN